MHSGMRRNGACHAGWYATKSAAGFYGETVPSTAKFGDRDGLIGLSSAQAQVLNRPHINGQVVQSTGSIVASAQ